MWRSMFRTRKSPRKKPKIALLGQYKFGTTGLFFKLKNSLPTSTRTLFESTQYLPERGDEDRYILAKVILGVPEGSHFVQYQTFLTFEKRIYLIRDPRDWVVSGTLFLIQADPNLYENDDKLISILDLLRQKERDPNSISLLEILEWILDSMPGQSIARIRGWILRQHRWLFRFERRLDDYCTVRYEDFVENEIAPLENYLGISLRGSDTVKSEQEHVVRTRGYGNWRDWFVPKDVEFFKPLFEEYLRRYGYPLEWSLNEQPRVGADHCTRYVSRVVNRKRALPSAFAAYR